MTNFQISVLSYCLDRRRTFSDIAQHFNVSVDDLIEHVLVGDLMAFLCSDTSADDVPLYTVWANNAGVAFIEQLRKDNRRFRIPVIISVAALAVSIAALCVSIWL